jgi:hypothetical protein
MPSLPNAISEKVSEKIKPLRDIYLRAGWKDKQENK